MAKAKKIYSKYDQLCILEDNLNWRDPITPGNPSKEGRIGIFQAYLNTDPKEFETEILPVIEDKYQEYFNIFQHPIYNKTGAEIRFRSVMGPVGFQEKVNEFFKQLSASEEQKSILLHLIAEVSSFRFDPRYGYFKEGGKHRTDKIIEELNSLKLLQHRLYFEEFNDIGLKEIIFKFKDIDTIKLTQPAVLISFISEYIRSGNIESAMPDKLKKDSKPGPKDPMTQFRNKLILGLYDFIIKEELGKPTDAMVNVHAVKFISDFLELCNIEIYSKKKPKEPALLPERYKVIENTIRRKK